MTDLCDTARLVGLAYPPEVWLYVQRVICDNGPLDPAHGTKCVTTKLVELGLTGFNTDLLMLLLTLIADWAVLQTVLSCMCVSVVLICTLKYQLRAVVV